MKPTVYLSLPLILFLFLFTGCERHTNLSTRDITLVDPHASPETQALYVNLDRIRHDQVLFGHQDDLAYGVHWVEEPGRSDVKEVAGSYPALYGWELGDLELGEAENLDNVNFDKMRAWIKEGYNRGGVITISWHMNNPVSGGHAWDLTPAVSEIIPDGERHDSYKEWLDTFSDFIKSLKVSSTQWTEHDHHIPIIFRPFHEHNGDWFWWARGHCTEEEYIALWRFTVEYLRDIKQLHNLLYAFSPDRSRMNMDRFKRDYLYGYPGDGYVDIIGLDNYWDVGHWTTDNPREDRIQKLSRSLSYITEIADERNKIPAFTETGYEAIPDPTWWTDILLEGIRKDNRSKEIAWVLVWRNANEIIDREGHFYAPYPGHPSAEDFIKFRNEPMILFEDDLPNMYTMP